LYFRHWNNLNFLNLSFATIIVMIDYHLFVLYLYHVHIVIIISQSCSCIACAPLGSKRFSIATIWLQTLQLHSFNVIVIIFLMIFIDISLVLYLCFDLLWWFHLHWYLLFLILITHLLVNLLNIHTKILSS
jgi:hypothetical protein